MRLRIKIDANCEEPETLITTARMTDEVNRIVDFINQASAVTTIISGIKNDKVELLEQESLFRIYAEEGKVFAKDEEIVWQCSNCGHQFGGKEAPEVCPVCFHEKAYFQQKPENY